MPCISGEFLLGLGMRSSRKRQGISSDRAARAIDLALSSFSATVQQPLHHFLKNAQSCIMQVDVSAAQAASATRGGAELASQKGDTASLEPREFLQGSEFDSAPQLLA